MSPEVIVLLLRGLMALALFTFFGLAVYVAWRSLPAASAQESVIPEIYALEYQAGSLIGRHRLRALNLIGRAADNTIVLNDDGVSAHHARLTFSSGQWLLEDLGSTNGTFVNDLPLESPLVVTLEDRVLVGGSTLELTDTLPLDEATFTL